MNKFKVGNTEFNLSNDEIKTGDFFIDKNNNDNIYQLIDIEDYILNGIKVITMKENLISYIRSVEGITYTKIIL